MNVSAWCSRRPYLDHLLPIWNALPEEVKGGVYVHQREFDYAESLGLHPRKFSGRDSADQIFIVFSRVDFSTVPRRAPLIFVEHGVGASYEGKSHLAGYGCNGAVARIIGLLTTPAQAPAHRALFGDHIVHAVGCPKLDKWQGYKHKRKRPPVVAFSHHWNQGQHPETLSAWPWDAEAWARVIESDEYRVIGHKHPGDPRNVEEWCSEHGIEFVESFDEVMARADLYVADNTSTLYEFAATGRPVVCLSPPWYRRDVNHGIRFWDHVPGVECALIDHLEACIAEALKDVPARRVLRDRAVEAVYGPLDGQATQRSVEIITALAATTVIDAVRPSKQKKSITYRNPSTGLLVDVPAHSARRVRYERGGWQIVTIPSGSAKKFRYERAGWKVIRPKVR